MSFYGKLPNERLIYVVFWEYDPTNGQGYVYLPAKADDWYRLNVGTTFHGVEGRWFRAWGTWDNVARPPYLQSESRKFKPLKPTNYSLVLGTQGAELGLLVK